jgi:hypothetical protein
MFHLPFGRYAPSNVSGARGVKCRHSVENRQHFITVRAEGGTEYKHCVQAPKKSPRRRGKNREKSGGEWVYAGRRPGHCRLPAEIDQFHADKDLKILPLHGVNTTWQGVTECINRPVFNISCFESPEKEKGIS